MNKRMKYSMLNVINLIVLFMGSSLFLACNDKEPEETVPPGVEEGGNELNQPSGEMGDPSQTDIYLWLEGNMPAITSYQTVANSSNPDGPDFCPNMVRVPVAEGIPIKILRV